RQQDHIRQNRHESDNNTLAQEDVWVMPETPGHGAPRLRNEVIKSWNPVVGETRPIHDCEADMVDFLHHNWNHSDHDGPEPSPHPHVDSPDEDPDSCHSDHPRGRRRARATRPGSSHFRTFLRYSTLRKGIDQFTDHPRVAQSPSPSGHGATDFDVHGWGFAGDTPLPWARSGKTGGTFEPCGPRETGAVSGPHAGPLASGESHYSRWVGCSHRRPHSSPFESQSVCMSRCAVLS